MSNGVTEGQKNFMRSKFAYVYYVFGMASGYDVTKSLGYEPLLGIFLGFAISAVALAILYNLWIDPNKKVKEACMGIGAFIGFLLGLYFFTNEHTETTAKLIVCFVCGGLGAAAGAQVASFLSLMAFLILIFSRGPISHYLHNIFS